MHRRCRRQVLPASAPRLLRRRHCRRTLPRAAAAAARPACAARPRHLPLPPLRPSTSRRRHLGWRCRACLAGGLTSAAMQRGSAQRPPLRAAPPRQHPRLPCFAPLPPTWLLAQQTPLPLLHTPQPLAPLLLLPAMPALAGLVSEALDLAAAAAPAAQLMPPILLAQDRQRSAAAAGSDQARLCCHRGCCCL